MPLPQRQSNDRADENLKNNQRRDGVTGQQKHRDTFIAQQSEPLHRAWVHGHAGGINLTQVGQHLTNILVTRTADRTRDHDDLTAQHLPLNDFPDTTGFTSGNADAMHICAGFPTGSRQGIGIHVKHLPQARFAVNIDQLRPHRQH